LKRNIGSSPRFEEMDAEIGTCFPMHVVVIVSLQVFFSTQIDSNSTFAEFSEKF